MRENIKTSREQMLTYLKQNGNYEITADQQNQLNQALNNNSQTIGEDPISSNH